MEQSFSIPEDKVDIIVARVQAAIQQECSLDFLQALEQSTADSNSVYELIAREEEGKDEDDGRGGFARLKTVFASAAVLMQLLATQGRHTVIQDGIDIGMKTAIRFLTLNFTASSSSSSSAAPSLDCGEKEKEKKGRQPTSAKKSRASSLTKLQCTALFQLELSRIFSPLITLIVDATALLLGMFTQEDKFCFFAQELVLSILRMDCGAIGGTESGAGLSSLVALQRAALQVFQLISQRYSRHRAPLLLEFLPILAVAYNVKSPVKLFTLHYHPSSRRVSLPLAAAMLSIQAVVGLSSKEEINAVSMDTKGGLVQEVKLSCSVFAGELLKRCSHKELSTSYRVLMLRLLEDCFALLLEPDFPVAVLLLETIVRIIVSQLYTLVANPGSKRDISYLNFLMDVLGLCASELRSHFLTTKCELSDAEASIMSPLVFEKVAGKLAGLRQKWLQEGEIKKGSSIRGALTIHRDVSAAVLETLINENNYFEGEKKSSAIYIPSSSSILSLLKQPDTQPTIPALDLENFMLAEFLRFQSSKRRVNICDARRLVALNWAQDASNRGHHELAEFALQSLAETLSSSTEGCTDLAGITGSGIEIVQIRAQQEERLLAFNSNEWIRRTVRSVLTPRSFDPLFNSILNAVLLLFAETSPLIRARTMRTLHSILRTDPDLISRPDVRDTLMERLYDAAICVREEAVKLVGSFIIKGGDVSGGEEYLRALLLRLDDKGVSVRKAVVSILREVLTRQPEHPSYADLCLRLLHVSAQPKEEDTVRDMIRSTFQQIWFLPPEATVLHSMASSAMTGPSPVRNLNAQMTQAALVNNGSPSTETMRSYKTFSAAREKQEVAVLEEETKEARIELHPMDPSDNLPLKVENRHLESTALQIVSVSTQIEDPNWVISVIRDTLFSNAEGAGTPIVVLRKRQASLQHCSKLVECLFELLLRCEENIAAASASSADSVEAKTVHQEKLVAILSAAALFVKAHPPFFLAYVPLLLPYLKGDNGMSYADECLVALNVTQMLEAGSVVHGFSLGSQASEVNNDLGRIAFKFSNLNINAAISCMAVLAVNQSRDASAMLALGERCYRSMQQAARQPLSSAQLARLQRCVVVMGYVCEHSRKCVAVLSSKDERVENNKSGNAVAGSEEAAIASTPFPLLSSAFSDVNMHALCYSAVLFCLSLGNDALKVRAAQALCSVFIGSPRLMLLANNAGLLRELLGGKQPDDVHRTMVKIVPPWTLLITFGPRKFYALIVNKPPCNDDE